MEDRFRIALERIDARRERRSLTVTAPAGEARLLRGAAALVDFSSNDYLGLSAHPLLAERTAEWAGLLGTGTGASRLVTGTRDAHVVLEQRIATFKGTEAALLFPSGWQCNAAVLAALLKAAPGALLVTDRLIHASLHAGAARHHQLRFRHNDLDHLEALLTAHIDHASPNLIVIESVFSMNGDRIDLPRLAAIARSHNNAFLYLNEAHATGVLGPKGRGLSAELPGSADLVMGTFRKAFGCFGAYVAGSQLLIDHLVNACGGFIFSTAPPPAMLDAIDAALDVVPGMKAERTRLKALSDRLRARLREAGIDTGGSSTQIIPAIVGNAAAALALADAVVAQGFLTIAIRPPTVPSGTSRLRIAVHATNDEEEVERLADAIVEQGR